MNADPHPRLPVGYSGDDELPAAILAGAMGGAFLCAPWGYVVSMIGCVVGATLGWWAGRARRRAARRAGVRPDRDATAKEPRTMKTDDDLVDHARVAQLLHFPRATDCVAVAELDGKHFTVCFYAPGETRHCYGSSATRIGAVVRLEAQLRDTAEDQIARAERQLAQAREALTVLDKIRDRGASP